MDWKVEIDLQLILTTPLHTGVGAGLAGYLDARTLLDTEGYPYVAGSTLKGRLRYYLQSLQPLLSSPTGKTDDAIGRLFGQQEQGGALIFADCHLIAAWRQLFALVHTPDQTSDVFLTQRRTSVMLSRLRGVAMEQRLFTVETVPAHFAFEGQIHGYLGANSPTITVNRNEYPRDLALVVAACRALTHLGGRKSRGLGRSRVQIGTQGLRVNGSAVDPTHLLEALK